jgi:hypothetical protein
VSAAQAKPRKDTQSPAATLVDWLCRDEIYHALTFTKNSRSPGTGSSGLTASELQSFSPYVRGEQE